MKSEIKNVVLETPSEQKSILSRSVADGLCNIFDEIASNILQNQFPLTRYPLIINTLNNILNKIFIEEVQFSLKGLYPFLEDPVRFIIKKVESPSVDLTTEAKLITGAFLSICREKLRNPIQKEIIAFFSERRYIDVNHLLRETFRMKNTGLMFSLIREQRADINKVTCYLPGASSGLSAISHFIPICQNHSLMSDSFLSILFDYGFNPQSRHPYYYYPSLPWLNLQTQIAFRQVKLKPFPNQKEKFKDSYIKIIIFQTRLIISTILNPLILPVLRQIIFEYIDDNAIDLQPFNRFANNEDPSQLLTQEIKQYNREVRAAFCFGLFSKNNNDSPLRNTPTSYNEATLSYKDSLSLVFQFAGVDRSDEDNLYNTINQAINSLF